MDEDYLKVAVARIRTPDGDKYLLQRRKDTAKLFPKGLSFFGGHIEPDETPEEAIRRELQEETSLDLGETVFHSTISMTVLPPVTGEDKPVEVHVFDAYVDHDFEAKEGASLEIHTREDALSQLDLVPTTRYVIEKEAGE